MAAIYIMALQTGSAKYASLPNKRCLLSLNSDCSGKPAACSGHAAAEGEALQRKAGPAVPIKSGTFVFNKTG